MECCSCNADKEKTETRFDAPDLSSIVQRAVLPDTADVPSRCLRPSEIQANACDDVVQVRAGVGDVQVDVPCDLQLKLDVPCELQLKVFDSEASSSRQEGRNSLRSDEVSTYSSEDGRAARTRRKWSSRNARARCCAIE